MWSGSLRSKLWRTHSCKYWTNGFAGSFLQSCIEYSKRETNFCLGCPAKTTWDNYVLNPFYGMSFLLYLYQEFWAARGHIKKLLIYFANIATVEFSAIPFLWIKSVPWLEKKRDPDNWKCVNVYNWKGGKLGPSSELSTAYPVNKCYDAFHCKMHSFTGTS